MGSDSSDDSYGGGQGTEYEWKSQFQQEHSEEYGKDSEKSWEDDEEPYDWKEIDNDESKMVHIHCPVMNEIVHSIGESRYLSDFTEIQFLGWGGFGSVVKCQGKLDKKLYAVKKILLKRVKLPFEKILREVRLLSKFEHPHIVRYFQAWLEPSCFGCYGSDESMNFAYLQESCLYILMEFCPRTLISCLEDSDRPCGEQMTFKILGQVARGLDFLHTNGVVHRDLSRGNIFLDESGNAKIGDFGLSKYVGVADSDSPSTSDCAPFYKAPERFGDEARCSAKSDIYSLGILLGEMLFTFATTHQRHEELTMLETNGKFPNAWQGDELIEKLVARDPLSRPTARELCIIFDAKQNQPGGPTAG